MFTPRIFGAALAVGLAFSAQATTLRIVAESNRSTEVLDAKIDQTVKVFAKNFLALSDSERKVRTRSGLQKLQMTPPVRVRLEGVEARGATRGGSSGLVLSFETSGNRAFPPEYRAFLQSVFDTAQSRLSLTLGQPASGGTVFVRNYDADLGDRDAVAGGVYLDNNGSGQREIRFPIYADGLGIKPEVTAVNFIHTLLLAYMGDRPLPWDGWNEGLVRAATMRVCRTPGSLPNTLDLEAVEQVLDSSYDIGTFYDWNNQRALVGPQFIANNLRNTPLPVGGSVGGLYLLRYLMSGSAFQKVLVQYPGFASSFLSSYYANPSAYQTVNALNSLAQTTISGLGGSVVEGRSFAEWSKRQFILDPSLVPGLKLQVQPFPILDGLAGTDFGVFAIQAHHFQTLPNGNETLLRETAFPIYWSPDFTRFFASSQDDRIDIVQAYGAVVPNFPGTPFSGQPYRVTVDVPLQGLLERVSLPAGAIATPASPAPKDVYGTVTGVPAATNQTLTVQIQYGSTTQNIPVQNFAFGAEVTDTAFDGSLPLTVRVNRTVSGNTTTLLTRQVNKGPGAIALNLNVDERTSTSIFLSQGIQMLGTAIDPNASRLDQILGTAESATQASRWNPLLGQYDFFPNSGSVRQGHAYFIRSETSGLRTIEGTQPANQTITFALQQGWNLVCNPLNRTVNRSELEFVTEAQFPKTYAEATGDLVGSDIFAFVPGATDPTTGFPETGSYTSINGIQPGQAFFIKVLAPFGATAVFRPTGASGLAAPVTAGNRWSLRTSVQGGGATTDAYIGQATQATDAQDRRFDIESPPGGGGLKIAVDSGLYRNTRAWGRQAVWDLNLSNLHPGTTYTVTFAPETNRMTVYTMRDRGNGLLRFFVGTRTYTFTATAPTRVISLQTVRPL